MLEMLVGLPLLVKALILGIVEGLTEFLPVSSTGHLILAGSLLGFHGDKGKVFDIAIQTGAMFAVIVYFRARISSTLSGLFSDPVAQRFTRNIIIAFMPAAVLGVLFASKIKAYLFYPVPVALALVIGGVIIIVVEKRANRMQRKPRITSVDELNKTDALKLGIAQAFALIPGTSRSGATIIGGMMFGLSRMAATEFSFYLAIPTLIGAGVYDTFKYRDLLSSNDIPLFAVGTIVSFFFAWACVAWLIRFVATRDFIPFGWYRIVFGLLVLVTAWTGLIDWAAA